MASTDSTHLVEIDEKLTHAADILSFLAGVTPHPGTILGEDGEHGQQLILFRAISLLQAAKREVDAAREVSHEQ